MIGDNGLECNGRVGWYAARTVYPTVCRATSDSASGMAWGDLRSFPISLTLRRVTGTDR